MTYYDEDLIPALVCKKCGARGCKGEVTEKDCIECAKVND